MASSLPHLLAPRALELVHTTLMGQLVCQVLIMLCIASITYDFTRWHWLKLVTNKFEEMNLEAFNEYRDCK
jgi:hypothetical protein